MVHLVTGYAGYAHIKSADDGAFNASFFGAGQYVMEFGNQFEGSIIDNHTVRILDGDGLMYGRHFRIEPNTYEDLNIETGTAGTSRIDLICMTYEKNADDETEKVYLQVIKGTQTAGTPSGPAYTDGNILEGASLNQMPLYKVKIEGVVLSEIEPMFDTIPSYEGLARMYADRFEAVCEELKEQFDLTNVIKRTDVVDNLLSTATDLPLSANQGKVLKGAVDLLNGNCIKEQESRYRLWSNGILECWGNVTVPGGANGATQAYLPHLYGGQMYFVQTTPKYSSSTSMPAVLCSAQNFDEYFNIYIRNHDNTIPTVDIPVDWYTIGIIE